MIKKLIVGPLMAVLFAGMGCASTGGGINDPTAEAVAKIAIQYGTMKYINEDVDRAAKVVAFVDAALLVAESEPATIDELGVKILALIPTDDLEPEDRLLIANLAELVVTELKRRVTTDPSIPLADVRQVLEWVKQAAILSAPQ